MAYQNFNFGSSNGGGSTFQSNNGVWDGMPAMPNMGMPDTSFMSTGSDFGSMGAYGKNVGGMSIDPRIMSSQMMGDNAGMLDMSKWANPASITGGAPGFTPSISQRLFGYSDPNTQGYVSGMAPALAGAALGLGQLGIGMKQYGLAKDQFKESKKQFALNYGAQKQDYNNQINNRAEQLYYRDPDRYGDPEERAAKQRIA